MKTYTTKQIKKILIRWFDSQETCSGKPHCCVEECDLCFNCFIELGGKFGIKIEGTDLTRI